MASTTTRILQSPFRREKSTRYDGRVSDSPFTEILLELAEEDINDQHPTSKSFVEFVGIDDNVLLVSITNTSTNAALRLSDIHSNSGATVGKIQGGAVNSLKPQWEQPHPSAEKIKRQLETPSSTGAKDHAVRMPPIESIPTFPQIDIQAREYLMETIALLDQRISYSQIQLQVLSSQLQHDLPDFVARAMQLFQDNNQHLLGTTRESSVLFFLEQKEFVDQAVSIYLRQFVPPPSCGSSCGTAHTQEQPIFTEADKAMEEGQSAQYSNDTDYMDWLIFNDTPENLDFEESEQEVFSTTSDTASSSTFTQEYPTKDFSCPIIPFTARKRACYSSSAITHTPVSPTADVRDNGRDSIRAARDNMMRSPFRMLSLPHLSCMDIHGACNG